MQRWKNGETAPWDGRFSLIDRCLFLIVLPYLIVS